MDECEPLMNGNATEAAWVAVLHTMAARYAGCPAVVAMELRNEPREVCPGRSWHVAGGVLKTSTRPTLHLHLLLRTLRASI